MEEMQARMKAALRYRRSRSDDAGLDAARAAPRRSSKFQKYLWDSARAAPGQERREIAWSRARFSPWPARAVGPGWRWCGCRGPGGPPWRRWPGGSPAPAPRVMRRLKYRAARIDQALLLWFPGPAQFHRRGCGGIPPSWRAGGARSAVLRLSVLGAGPAEPGEFSRRAVENGRLDLTRAEPGRSHRCRNPGPAAPGAAPV